MSTTTTIVTDLSTELGGCGSARARRSPVNPAWGAARVSGVVRVMSQVSQDGCAGVSHDVTTIGTDAPTDTFAGAHAWSPPD